ncbi:MAG: cellulose biosynthesis protein BcsQ [Burkholderiales bacterium]
MEIIAVIGAVGGAGATTVAAHLSVAFASQKRRTLTIDFCSENILRLHFGMAFEDGTGFAPNLLAEKEWSQAAYRSGGGLEFIPFGQLHNDQELDSLVEGLRQNPTWFRTQLANLQLPPGTLVVCNCPRMPAVLREQVIRAADMVLMVAAPEVISFAAVTHIANKADNLAHAHGSPTLVVLNGFDPARQLDRDIAVLLRTEHRQIFSPVVVHRDESVREALACKQTVFDFAPSSQAAYDFLALSTWLLARLGQAAKAA